MAALLRGLQLLRQSLQSQRSLRMSSSIPSVNLEVHPDLVLGV